MRFGIIRPDGTTVWFEGASNKRHWFFNVFDALSGITVASIYNRIFMMGSIIK